MWNTVIISDKIALCLTKQFIKNQELKGSRHNVGNFQ